MIFDYIKSSAADLDLGMEVAVKERHWNYK